MLRITLGGAGLADFPEDSDGGYIKLRLGETEPDGSKASIRTYTVRRFDASRLALEVDFVLHDIGGPAANWARACNIGDEIEIRGPGPKKPLDPNADWVLVAGDMSALPAIAANIEALPRNAKGVAVLEIIDADDEQQLDAPEGLEIRWLVNSHPDRKNTLLQDALRSVDWLEGKPYCWVAGEFTQALAIRRYLREEKHVTREHMYASSYWQIGHTEDGHRISKRQAAAG